jgi:hypothetical protein
VARAVRNADLDDPCLQADAVRALQRTPPRRTNDDTAARELVFYWTMWKKTMAAGDGLQAADSAEPVARGR